MNNSVKFVLAMALTVSGYAKADGIGTHCALSDGGIKLAILADASLQGGYRLTLKTFGSYPTEETLIGTTKVLSQSGKVLEVQLTEKAYELIGIPVFSEELTNVSIVTIDQTDPKNITATYNGVTLICGK